MSKRTVSQIGIFGIILLVLFGWWLWTQLRNSYPIVNYPPKGTLVLAFGDSLIEGIGASNGHDVVSVLSERLHLSIVNKGHSGDTTRDALLRIERDVLDQHPNIVMLLFGGNDHLQQIPDDETFANLHTLIGRLQQSGATVILLGVRGRLLNDIWEPRFKDLARKDGCVYIPDVLRGLFGKSSYMSDQVHPNDVGYEKMADRIAPILESLIVNGVK